MFKKLRNNKTIKAIGAWINNNYIVKIIVATLLELLKHTGKSLAVWLTGLFLVGYLSNIHFISFGQCFLVCLWFKIIIFNFNKSNS